jgi:hypothetical protein
MTMAQKGFPISALRDEHQRGAPRVFARLQTVVGALDWPH